MVIIVLTISRCAHYMKPHNQTYLSIENIVTKVLSYIKNGLQIKTNIR